MEIEDLVKKINTQYSEITGINCHYNIIEKGENHIPSILEKGKQGVYVFYNNDICYKVGKAGPKSKARWNSHHYNLDLSTPSTMPKSILKDLLSFKQLFAKEQKNDLENLNSKNIKSWVRNNCSRIEFKISDSESKFSLGLLESIVQFYFNPIFERTHNYRNKIKFIKIED